MNMPKVALFVGTPASEAVAGAGRARPLLAKDPSRDTAEFILDVVSRPARDSGARLNLTSIYLNSEGPAAIGDSVRAIAERGVLQVHPETVETIRQALSLKRPLAAIPETARSRILQALHLLLHEGDHLAGAPFDDAAGGTTSFGGAAARNFEEGLAELRASQLLPDLVRSRFGLQLTAAEANRYWGLHQGSANVALQAVSAASRNTGRAASEIIKEFADDVPGTQRLARIEALIGDRISPIALEAQLSFQQ